ncbi:MAG: aldolase/citrate lyase family protein [Bryobacteraceae bacterium]|nr:aldolase/citrate lyase family protein [Bryobacteraceae bacterium]
MKENHCLQALRAGQVQYGCGYGQLRQQEAINALAKAGFNWAFIDMEHGGFDYETVQDLCRMGRISGLSPVVRVADLQYSLIARALDCGAEGIMLPRVEDPKMLEKAISWTKFPPQGIRGYGLTPTNLDYEPATMPAVIEHVNRNTMVVFQIETVAALERRDELTSVPGIDVLMVGPADLSISLGCPGDFMNAKQIDAMEKIRDTCHKYNVVPGTQTRTVQLASFWKKNGMLFLGCSNETSMLFDRASEIIQALKAAPASN